MVICLGRGADWNMTQLIPLPLIVSCSRLVLVLLAHPDSRGQNPESHSCSMYVSIYVHTFVCGYSFIARYWPAIPKGQC